MNKQEIMNKIDSLIKTIAEEPFTTFMGYSHGENTAFNICRGLIEQLDEPQKVKVPKYVAELFDYYRNSTDVDLLALLITFNAWYSRTDKNGKYEEAIDWLVKHPEKFMRAWLDGYEVEKKPKWVVLGKRGYLTSLSIGKGKSTGWTGNSDKYGSGAIHFEEEDIAQYTAYIVNGEVEPAEVAE